MRLTRSLLPLAVLAVMLAACGTTPAATATGPAAPTEAVPTQAVPATETVAATPIPPTETPAPVGPSFAKDVLPILNSRCINCHGGRDIEEGLNMKTYGGLMTGSMNGAVIIPGNAADSLLVQEVQNGNMPKRGPKLTPGQIQIIIDWINAGALDN